MPGIMLTHSIIDIITIYFFVQVQGKDPSVDITQDFVEESEDERFEDMSDTAPPVELPPCELNKLETINEVRILLKIVAPAFSNVLCYLFKLIASCLSSAVRREKLSTALEMEGYIRKLLNLFHICEDLENIEGLNHLFEVFKNIFLLNKNALFEVMFAEDTIFDVVGCLEYDPNAKIRKKHRDYLRQMAKFKEVIPITNPELLAKIHQTYRVQYIQVRIMMKTSSRTFPNTTSIFIFDRMLSCQLHQCLKKTCCLLCPVSYFLTRYNFGQIGIFLLLSICVYVCRLR